MKHLLLIALVFSIIPNALAQELASEKQEPPAFKITRAAENYAYLKDKESSPFEATAYDAIKYVSLVKSGNAYLTIGGQVRTRFEYFNNRFWLPEEDINFYSQRLALHTNLVIGKHFRVFGELYHGYTNHEKAFAEYDELDIFQAFAEITIVQKENQSLKLIAGRQEMGLGAARLIGIREGPNIRRSYDMGQIVYTQGKTKVHAFYGKEVRPLFLAFDNEFSLFDGDANNPQLWGVYTQFKIKGLNGMNEIYYLGFQADNTSFNDVNGDETRHTIGLRRFGRIGKSWKYNTEVIYQFGTIGTNEISAFSIDTDWHYELVDTKWQWTPGLKLEYTSGDKREADGKINSFNPMFVNPAFYSLAATVTPVNIMGIHPSVNFRPIQKLKLYAEWAIFWRASKSDALYRPTRFINRPSNGVEARNIGHQFGGKIQYEFDRNLSFDLDVSYFVAGDFLKESGEAENILHIAPTLNYRF